MNSRTRSRPPLARGSSRSLVWIWYQLCGRSRYERISCAACQVTISSWVMPSTKSRPARSLSRNCSVSGYRPVVCQISAGWRIGIDSSCAPMRSISSLRIASMRRMTRSPNGMRVYRPAARWRASPARIMRM